MSANPTGPLTVGNARGAFVGDLLCRVLEAAGHHITREYYFNDSGRQVRVLGASVAARKRGEGLPEEAYRGAYVDALARDMPDATWAAATAPGADTDAIVGAWASERIRAGIEASLDHLGVRFDVWKSEATLHRDGWVERAVARLRKDGHVFEQEGATWFRSTAFGDDKDRVIHRSNGEPTYFAADIGYVTEKFSRGFDKLIYVWGADHHGTVARLRNAAQAMGYDPDAVEVILVAWVRFVRDGQELSMSKRAGEFITLDELLAEVGVDAARWSFAARAASTPIDVDIELARKQSSENPVYYVQYAHARICSILRKATEAGLTPAGSLAGTLGGDAIAQGLARQVLRLPRCRGCATAEADPRRHGLRHGVPRVPRYYARTRHRPRGPGHLHRRLALVDAARLALRNTLGAPGISTRREEVTRAGKHAGLDEYHPAGLSPGVLGLRPGGHLAAQARASCTVARVASSLASRTSTGAVCSPVRSTPGRTAWTPAALSSRAFSTNSCASGSLSQAVCQTMAHASPGPSAMMRRSPPQPSAANATSPSEPPSASNSRMPSSPTVWGYLVVQPLPSAAATSGREMLAGRSVGYRSGWRICSVDAGRRSQASFTACQPPC